MTARSEMCIQMVAGKGDMASVKFCLWVGASQGRPSTANSSADTDPPRKPRARHGKLTMKDPGWEQNALLLDCVKRWILGGNGCWNSSP